VRVGATVAGARPAALVAFRPVWGGGPGFEGGAPEATWDVPEGGDEFQPPQYPEEGTSEDASQDGGANGGGGL